MTVPQAVALSSESALAKQALREINEIRTMVASLAKKNGNGNGAGKVVIPQWVAAALFIAMLGLMTTLATVVNRNATKIATHQEGAGIRLDRLEEFHGRGN